jgi:hypothetical protein
VTGGPLLDLCGVAALVAGLLSPAGLVPALAVGYGATALGGLCTIGLIVRRARTGQFRVRPVCVSEL